MIEQIEKADAFGEQIASTFDSNLNALKGMVIDREETKTPVQYRDVEKMNAIYNDMMESFRWNVLNACKVFAIENGGEKFEDGPHMRKLADIIDKSILFNRRTFINAVKFGNQNVSRLINDHGAMGLLAARLARNITQKAPDAKGSWRSTTQMIRTSARHWAYQLLLDVNIALAEEMGMKYGQPYKEDSEEEYPRLLLSRLKSYEDRDRMRYFHPNGRAWIAFSTE